MLHLKGFPDQLADDPTQPAEGTVLLIKEGSNVVPTNLLKGSVANLGGYEDALPCFNENDSVYRVVWADALIEKTLVAHRHRCPPHAFYTEYFGRDASWKDYEEAKGLFAENGRLNPNLWFTSAEWKMRKEHPYFEMVKRFYEWQHSTKHRGCKCNYRPHQNGSFLQFQ